MSYLKVRNLSYLILESLTTVIINAVYQNVLAELLKTDTKRFLLPSVLRSVDQIKCLLSKQFQDFLKVVLSSPPRKDMLSHLPIIVYVWSL